VMVMYLGRVAEHGACDAIFESPQHPYTRALLSATPMVDAASRRQRIVLKGELPSPLDPPTGCAFHTRCPIAMPVCSQRVPELALHTRREAACHALEVAEPTRPA